MILKQIKDLGTWDIIELKESSINNVYYLEVLAEGILVFYGDSFLTLCGQGYQINEYINKYYMYKNEVEVIKHKSLMRFSAGHH